MAGNSKANTKAPKKGSNLLCRISNPTPQKVCEFVRRLPKQKMQEEDFRNIMGKDWFANEHQAPEQWGLYYIDGLYYYPRFNRDITLQEAEIYLNGWLKRFIVINPYTRFKKTNDNGLVLSIVKHLEQNPSILDLKTIMMDIIGDDEPFIINDILVNTLNTYSEVFNITTQDKNAEQFSVSLLPNYKEIINSKYTMTKKEYFELFNDIIIDKDLPLQKIVYGAPGTGKSHGISEIVDKKPDEDVFRTTFHPDSDYSTFVGCYKPMTKDIEMRDVAGHRIVEDGDYVITNNIVYEFVPQAFTNAYVRAYETTEPVFLVIEEINRGNCAQIFGDIFQLLDRDDNGWSSYAVKPDTDLSNYLKKKLGDKYNENKGMKLPPNLYIWATMNTSDQSLFPIDSAFKRRWDWEYMPIDKGTDENGKELEWKIKVGEAEYDWWSFLTIINDLIASDPSLGEDKQLGYFFCKAKEGIIDEKMFVNKVCFYLWNDVFKDFLPTHKALQTTDESSKSRNIRFTDFFKEGHTALIKNFLKELGVKDIDEEEDEDGNNKFTPPSKRDYTKYKINGEGRFGKNKLASECVKKYIELNPGVSVETVLSEWKGLDMKVPHFIESKEEYDARTDNSKRSVEIKCGDTVIYVAHNGYGSNGKAPLLMEKINEKGWGIKVEEIKDKEA